MTNNKFIPKSKPLAKKVISVRLNAETQKLLDEFTEKYNMSQGTAIAYFATLALDEWKAKNNFSAE